jgi:hypothetical protein
MRTRVVAFILLCGMLCTLSVPAVAQDKLAQTGMKFLSVGTDARAVGMGEAYTALEGTSSSMFFNPASMARLKGSTSLMLGHAKWIADIKHYYGAIAFSPFGGDFGVLGFAVQSVDYGTFEGTIRAANDKGYLDESDLPGLDFKPNALVLGVGYARALSEKFSIGANLKYVRQALGEAVNVVGAEKASNTTSVLAFDFGILYKTGFRSLNFGMTVRNFSKEVRYQKEGFQLPLTFKIGLSMNVFDLTEIDQNMHSVLLSVDAVHPRDYPEQLMVGAEYVFMKILALRVGYVGPANEHRFSYGVGIQTELQNMAFGVDYAYTPFGVFGDVHRFTFQFSL